MKDYSNEIVEIESQMQQIRVQRFELMKAAEVRLKEVFDFSFNIFREFTINVNNTTASFCMDNEEGKSKEIFSISFYERYKQARQLDLSYYSTSTKSQFELDRLIHLGKVASTLKSNAEYILEDIEGALSKDRQREDELYEIENTYSKRLSEIRQAQQAQKRVQVELMLRGDGVLLEKFINIELKRNYVPLVSSIKIVEVSKSGKTCTVVFSTASRDKGREERCDTQSILNQVTSRFDSIVKGELLPL